MMNNRNLPRVVITLVVAAGIGIFSFFNSSSQDNILDFNDKIVDLVEEADASFADYITEFDLYYYRDEVDQDLLKREAEKIKSVIDSTKSSLEGLNVPNHDICREFQTVAIKYIDNCAQLYEAFFHLNEYIRNNSPAKPDNIEYVDDLLDPIYMENEIIFNDLVETQERMADELDFEFE